MILIFTNENEFSSIEVAKRLRFYKKEYYIINPEENIFKFSRIDPKGIYFTDSLNNIEINFLDVQACWWRRTGLGISNFTQSLSSEAIINNINYDFKEILFGERSVLKFEFLDLKDYIFQKVFETAKINLGHPKLFNLNRLSTMDLASKIGLTVPYYEVISNSEQINLSENITDDFVTKAISNGLYHVIDGKSYYTYTELQHKKDFAGSATPLFPSLVVNLVKKKFEIRAFYLEGKFFSMAIFSQSNKQTEIDFRKYSTTKPNRNEPFQLPKEIEEKLHLLFKTIGLNTGSVDLIIDDNDDYIFLEINPIGQYGMTSLPGNYNLDDLIAKYLIYGTIS